MDSLLTTANEISTASSRFVEANLILQSNFDYMFLQSEEQSLHNIMELHETQIHSTLMDNCDKSHISYTNKTAPVNSGFSSQFPFLTVTTEVFPHENYLPRVHGDAFVPYTGEQHGFDELN